MRMSWKIGKVAGIDLYLHPTFLFVLVFSQMGHRGSFGLALTLATFGCVLLHELGHALMARRFGIGTVDITLSMIGGIARLTRMPKAPGAELLIALAGPAVNVAIAAGLLGLEIMGFSGPFVSYMLVINLVLAAFNLIPAFPMDGGRVLRAGLSGWLGRVQATRVAAGIGQALALAFGVYSLLNGFWFQVFLSAFIYMAAGTELASVIAEENKGRPDRDDDIWTAPPGYRWVSRGDGAWQLAPIVVHASDGHRVRWR